MKRQTSSRAAFTLAEILVVIVIIGALAALLLPAVLKARGASDRMEATQRLSALSLALDQFFNDFGYYPPTDFGYNPAAGGFTGTAAPTPTVNYYGDNVGASYGYSEALVQCLCNQFTKGSGDENPGDEAVKGIERIIGNAPVNAGPYLEIKRSGLSDIDSDGYPEMVDPWNNPYIYIPPSDYVFAATTTVGGVDYDYRAGALERNLDGTDPVPSVLTTDVPPLNTHRQRFKYQLISLGPDGWTPGLNPTLHAVYNRRYWDITIEGNPYDGTINPALIGTDDEPSAPVTSAALGHNQKTADDINNWGS